MDSLEAAYCGQKLRHCCKKYNKMNNKIEQGINRYIVVIFTAIKLNKSIDFFALMCYHKSSRDD